MQKNLKETVGFIRKKSSFRPEVLIVLGSGLGRVADEIDKKRVFSYKAIPHFKVTGVQTHKGKLVFGNLGGKRVMIMQGRPHVYEGYNMTEVAYPVMAASRLGAKTLIVTNLSGGINRRFKVGDFMVVRDHIDLVGDNPLIGIKDKKSKTVFVDMHNAYSPELIKLIKRSALRHKIALRQGVLAFLTGPSFETPSELRLLKTIGADAIGWSIVPEVLMARYAGMQVLGISCISDMSVPGRPQPVNLQDIFIAGEKKADQLYKLLKTFLGLLR